MRVLYPFTGSPPVGDHFEHDDEIYVADLAMRGLIGHPGEIAENEDGVPAKPKKAK